MIRIAVVEDEELYAEQLQNYISKYAEERKKQIKVTWFQDGEKILCPVIKGSMISYFWISRCVLWMV
ncbi:MAG: hypothetical protein V8T31_09545 [Lachnospiraceae bacterium]